MNSSRRKFLKLAGMAALGITAGKYEKIFGLTGYSNTQHSQSASKSWAMVIDISAWLKRDVRHVYQAAIRPTTYLILTTRSTK